ncbi:MAG: FAD-dependent oxidoreductase [Pseudomonadota bacterium]|nr:FAD-dependent oxidoreductase [Pseudomonadota bacterium]
MTSDQTVAVIGAGQAGGWTAKTLRDEGFKGQVILIGDEDYPPHERPPLSKEVLLGKAEKEACFLWPPEILNDAKINMRPGVTVTSINPTQHTLSIDGDEDVKWDKLMIATGGQARTLPVEGKDLDGVFTLRTIADAEAIRTRLLNNTKVLIVGAGWIGLEVAAAARNLGAETVVIEVADRVCARAVTPEMSQWILELHLKNGVDVRLGVVFDHFAGSEYLERAVLADGSEIMCDIAVVGIGLRPNTELAELAGLAVDNGIVVNEIGQTSHPDIYAAGDVANHPNSHLGRRIRLESWENAQNQAICAAKAMLGATEPYAEIPWFWSDQFDANIQLMGLPEDWDERVLRGDREAGEFIEFYLKAGKLEGAAAVNNARDLRFTRRMIESGRTFEQSSLSNPDIKLQKLLRG